ncbi:MAG: hypothetical protein HYS45_02810, partial [Parcubacteria group bacterium]|nr:hypothetical protein [Parcubacteria group bacterium]
RLLSTAPGTLFRLNSLRQRLKDTPESAATDALAAIREIPNFVDGELSGASITETAEKTFRALRGLIRASLPNLGVERVLRELANTRVALGERTQEALPLAHFLNAVEVDAVEEEARSVQTAKSGLILAMGKRPGIFGQLSSRVRNRILYEQREATEALDGAVASLFSRVCRIADAVLRNALNAKLEELRSHYRSYLDQLIRVLEGAQAELSEEGARVAGQVDQVVAEGRMERSATRLSLFPSDAVLQQVAHVDEQSVASAFEVLFSWDGSNLPRRTDRPLEDVASFAADADVPFAPLFLGDANAKSFITDALRDAEPFVRINERGLQGLASVTRRVFLVYPKALAPFVETLSTDRSLVHLVQAQVPAIFVFKQADTLPSSAFQSLCEYDTVLQAALAADAREQDGVVETLISFPLARYRRAPRVLDSETAKRHRRAAASLLLNPEVGAFDSDHPDAGWARFSLVARNGSRVPILGPDAPMHAQCPLFQNNAGIWHIRFLDHRGNYRERSMGTHVLAYALDLVAQHGRYQAAISAWIEQCAQACGPDVAEAFGLALSAFEQWCRDAEDDIRNELGGDAEAIGRRNLFTEVLPPADMVCTLARELTEPDEWFLQFGVRYENQRLFPGVAAAAGAV